MGQLSNRGRERNEIWHKGSPGDEDDVRTSNTHIAQRKCAIPHVTMKNKCPHDVRFSEALPDQTIRFSDGALLRARSLRFGPRWWL